MLYSWELASNSSIVCSDGGILSRAFEFDNNAQSSLVTISSGVGGVSSVAADCAARPQPLTTFG